jgi:hypothetical protein
MLHNAPALLAPRRPTRNPEQVLKQCESQDDDRRAGPEKSGASGAVRVHTLTGFRFVNPDQAL